MFTNRFILAIGLLALLLVALTVSHPISNDPTSVDTSWPPRPVIRPIVEVSNLDAYYGSERISLDPQAGFAIYYNSERTRVLAHFNEYQRSEWFGR